MVSLNRSRADFLEKFQKLIDRYNAGSKNVEAFFVELFTFSERLGEEERRAMREGMTEEELALFDILTKPEPELSEKERKQVKAVATLEIIMDEGTCRRGQLQGPSNTGPDKSVFYAVKKWQQRHAIGDR